ncbi:hypothetical protein [Stenotrophomonas maltophilia]|uniref:hypothetical protein n=1 Tax=Stenotrophomonas maltophilia TaxID=40324 RepID=UPI002E787242|nr:hypothetical protein [Stenotrophomonas maltophilia]
MLDWSAIATATAAVVALIVGIAPLVWAKCQRARIGRAKARIAEVDLKVQALHLAAGLQLISEGSTRLHYFRVATRQFRVLNADSCRDLVPYLDSLPNNLEAPLSDVISDIGIGIRLLEDLEPKDRSRVVNTTGPRALYTDILESMQVARTALSKVIGNGYTLEPVDSEAVRMAEALRKEAIDELLDESKAGPRVR